MIGKVGGLAPVVFMRFRPQDDPERRPTQTLFLPFPNPEKPKKVGGLAPSVFTRFRPQDGQEREDT